MFLVDDTGRIVHANTSGHVMLAEGAALGAPGGKLVANDAARRRLRRGIPRCRRGDAAVGVRASHCL